MPGNRMDRLIKMASDPIWIVIGGQWGSEGKGAFIGWLADPENPENILRVTGNKTLAVVRTGGPQAGHTILYKGKPYAMRQIPCAWHNPDAVLFIGPGALIDVELIAHEAKMVDEAVGIPGYVSERLFIDRHATIVEEKHRQAETDLVKGIGSTGEGVGAAQADKVMRRAKVAEEVDELRAIGNIVDVGQMLRNIYRKRSGQILVESTQGWGLSLNGPFYPTCTSRDITPAQALSDAGLPSNFLHSVVMVMRTFPIRVAGPSGEMGEEVTWDDLSAQTGGYIKPERTTVTKRIRRIAKWNPEYIRMATDACNPDAIAISFFDYLRPDLANQNQLDMAAIDEVTIMEADADTKALWVSTGFQNWIPTVPVVEAEKKAGW